MSSGRSVDFLTGLNGSDVSFSLFVVILTCLIEFILYLIIFSVILGLVLRYKRKRRIHESKERRDGRGRDGIP